MFARLIALLTLRNSTGFLLARLDDRLLDDIGLTRAELGAMQLGLAPAEVPMSRNHAVGLRGCAA